MTEPTPVVLTDLGPPVDEAPGVLRAPTPSLSYPPREAVVTDPSASGTGPVQPASGSSTTAG